MSFSLNERALLRGIQLDYDADLSLANWFPVALEYQAGDRAPLVCWRFLGERALTAAFFADSLQGLRAEDRRVCRTPVSALQGFANGVPPSAFIFHVSRCGSTLVTQSLAVLPHCIAVSEPPALDAFFRMLHQHPDLPNSEAIFRGLINAFGQRRNGREKHLFVKLDSWHTPWMPWLRQCYPTTPFVFVYRQPNEVLASHARQRGPQMVPGLVDTGPLQHLGGELPPADLAGYGSCVLDAIFESAVSALDSMGSRANVTLINYSQVPQVLWGDLLARFSVQCNSQELAAMQTRAGFHSKHGTQKFEGDPPLRGAQSPSAQLPRSTSSQHCYDQLEVLRLAAAQCGGA